MSPEFALRYATDAITASNGAALALWAWRDSGPKRAGDRVARVAWTVAFAAIATLIGDAVAHDGARELEMTAYGLFVHEITLTVVVQCVFGAALATAIPHAAFRWFFGDRTDRRSA